MPQLVFVASNGGRAQDPDWWITLQRRPLADVQVRGEIRQMVAAPAAAEEKRRLWPLMTRMYPGHATYQQRTERHIPVVLLRPTPTP
jgi:deazaflavin-dependent oxidoreductase (nitroreductase family)